MKKYVFALAAAVCLVACGEPDAKEASLDLAKAFFSGDIEKVLAYMPNERNKKHLAHEVELAKGWSQENGGVKSMEVVDVKESGNKTSLSVRVTFANGKSKELGPLDLYQKDGKWIAE